MIRYIIYYLPLIPKCRISTVKTRIIEQCAMKSRISFSGTGAKNTGGTQPLSPSGAEFFFFLTLPREESPTTYVAHGSTIQVSPVVGLEEL